MEDIRCWILSYLEEQSGLVPLDDKPLFAQLDSFAVIDFLLACDEQFHCFESLEADRLSRLTLDGVVAELSCQVRR